MSEKKVRRNIVHSYRSAVNELKEYGNVHIDTGGGEQWNHEVASRLTEEFGAPVFLVGPSELRQERDDRFYVYTLKLKTNREASVLLSEE